MRAQGPSIAPVVEGAAWRRWLPLLLWLAFVASVIVCADRGTMPAALAWVGQQPWGDKAGHVFLIGTLALLFNHALAGRWARLGRRQMQLGGLIVGLLMTAEEFSQLWIPGRAFELADLLANYAGILAAELLTRRWAAGGQGAPPTV